MTNKINIRKLEADLWESAGLLQAGSCLNANTLKAESASAARRLPFSLPGVNFHERMNEIHCELTKLNKEANVMVDDIQKAWEELK